MILAKQFNLDEGEMFLVRKPQGWTSFDVVARMRSIFHIEKIGHAGSLDPRATGLMIVCTGKMTKQIDQFVGLEKEYIATIRLGGCTESYDLETPVVEERTVEGITGDSVVSVLRQLIGHQVQLPPMWSAAKFGGKRLYKYARKGRVVDRKPREIFIRSIEPINVRIPDVTFRVVCSKGTYIRTLADEIGQRLGCGAYLTALERTRIGGYRIEDALSMDELLQFKRSLQDA
ncbi:MAG: tRNA pseudouridine(55) synthase [Bacteroidetes bacterium]|nr:tRNA pseudouridine(55) synthase [Bacteroidota bacterium]